MQNDFFYLESGRSTNLFQQLDNPNIHNETQTYKAKKKKKIPLETRKYIGNAMVP